MARDNGSLSNQLAAQGAKMTPLAIQSKLEEWKTQHGEKLQALAGGKDVAEKVFVICMNTIAKSPGLLECAFPTIAACILQSFQLNLFPGPFQECAYVPLNNRKTGQKEANFWPQYQGIVKLMRNAGNKAVVARVVCEGDFFEYHEGWKPPQYAPAAVMKQKRGAPLFVYAAVCTMHDMWQVEVMSPEQIAVIKSRSPGAQKSDSPWNSRYEDDVYAMWAKTCLKRVAKWCTKSAELITAVELDNEVDGDPSFVKPRIVDISTSPTAMAESIDEGDDEMEDAQEPRQLDAPKQSIVMPSPKAPEAVRAPQQPLLSNKERTV